MSVYIVATPYHFTLACGIASYVDTAKEKYLIISPHFKDAEILTEALKRWPKNPFKDWAVLEYREDKSAISKVRTIRKNLEKIKQLADDSSTAYICNIEQPEGQMLAHLVKNSIYVEDGIGAYLKRTTKDNLLKRYLKKLLYGEWFERVDNQMDCRLLKGVMAFRPGLLDTPLAKYQIPQDVFKRLKDDGLMGLLSKAYGIGSVDCEIIVLIPYSGQASAMGYSATLSIYREILAKLHSTNVAIKYHPREKAVGFIIPLLYTPDGLKDIRTIPNHISAELLFAVWDSPRKILIGDTSTGLYSCKLIAPDAEVISMMGIIGYKDDELAKVLDAYGIKRPKTMEELIEKVKP